MIRWVFGGEKEKGRRGNCKINYDVGGAPIKIARSVKIKTRRRFNMVSIIVCLAI